MRALSPKGPFRLTAAERVGSVRAHSDPVAPPNFRHQTSDFRNKTGKRSPTGRTRHLDTKSMRATR